MPTRSPEIITRASQLDGDLVPEPWDARDADSDRSLVAERERYRLQGATDGQGAGIVPAYNLNVADTEAIPQNTQDEWTRGSAGRVLNAQGQYVSRGSDVPRKSFDGEDPGLLVEAASRTNIIENSADLKSGWNPALGPNGVTLSAATSVISGETAQLVQSGGGNNDRIRQSQTGTFSGGQETLSIVVEKNTSDKIGLRILDSTQALGNGIIWDWSSNSFTTNVNFGSISRTDFRDLSANGPNGGRLVRLIIEYSGVSGNGRKIDFLPDRKGDGESVYFHHIQNEEAPNASSPIVTGGSPTTRSADDYAIFSGGQPPWWNPNEGTLVFDISIQFQEVDAAESSMRICKFPSVGGLRVDNGFGGQQFYSTENQSDTAINDVNPFSIDSVALSFDDETNRLSVNGVSASAPASSDIAGTDTVQLASGLNRMLGIYHKSLYIPRALPESTLNQITS